MMGTTPSQKTGEGLPGGCLCGAVRYQVSDRPLMVEYCHCGMCRKGSGGAVVAWADFPVSSLEWNQGKPRYYASSERALRGFCGNCGSSLTFAWKGAATLSLAVATLDDPSVLAPRQHLYSAYRLSWLTITDSLPHHAEAAPAAPEPSD